MTSTNTEIPGLTPDVGLILETPYRVYDSILGVSLCLLLLIGLPGNCLALTYFIKTNRRNLSKWLYIAASSIDIMSCMIHLPVVVSMFNNREPGMMKSEIFCTVWYFLLLSVQVMSMYVVMLRVYAPQNITPHRIYTHLSDKFFLQQILPALI